MNNNPFHTEPLGGHQYYNWIQLTTKPYSIQGTHCTNRLYAVLCQAVEHHSQYAINICYANNDNDTRRRLSQISRCELQQSIRLANLTPNDNGMLIHAVDIIHLSIQLTAYLAQLENDKYVKRAMDYILIEHCDNLYRIANLIDSTTSLDVQKLVDDMVDIIPTRPTISQHIHPHDCIKRSTNYKQCASSTIVHITLLHALSQYATNYYTNILAHYTTPLGRQLLAELAHIASQHSTIYTSLVDTQCSALDKLLIVQYAECYCYYSAYSATSDKIYWQHYQQELYHLHSCASILQHSCDKVWQQILGSGKYPDALSLGDNRQYICKILCSSINITSLREDYCDSATLDKNSALRCYQEQLNSSTRHVPSHCVVCQHIADYGCDYRQSTTMHPIEQLENRKHDNTTIGRII